MARGKNSRTTISNASAMRNMRGRSDASRAIDAVRPSKKIDARPTKRWADKMGKRDAKNIDDGSPRAKARNAGSIKRHFGKIGRRGAYATNRKKANAILRDETDHMKALRGNLADAERSSGPQKESKVEFWKDRIRISKGIMIKQQRIIANKPD